LNRPHYYGWQRHDGEFCLSRMPPDSPIRPALHFETIEEVRAFAARRRDMRIDWWPPLSEALRAQIQDGLRLERRR